MSTSAEEVEVYKHIYIACYILCIPTLALWIGLSIKIIVLKQTDKFQALVVICFLMVVAQLFQVAGWQFLYLYYFKSYKEE